MKELEKLPYVKELVKSLDYMDVKLIYNPSLDSPDIFFVLESYVSFPLIQYFEKYNVSSDSLNKQKAVTIDDWYVNMYVKNERKTSQFWLTEKIKKRILKYRCNAADKILDILGVKGKFGVIGIYEKSPRFALITLIHEYFHATDYFLHGRNKLKFLIPPLSLEEEIYEMLTDLRTLFVIPEKYIYYFEGTYLSLNLIDNIYLKEHFGGNLKYKIKDFSKKLTKESKLRNLIKRNYRLSWYKKDFDEKINTIVNFSDLLTEKSNKNLLFFG